MNKYIDYQGFFCVDSDDVRTGHVGENEGRVELPCHRRDVVDILSLTGYLKLKNK